MCLACQKSAVTDIHLDSNIAVEPLDGSNDTVHDAYVSLRQFLKATGEVRDGILVIATTIYVIGYITWTLYAWRMRFGPVDVVDTQYFAAGLPVAGLIACTALAIFILERMTTGPWTTYVGGLAASSRQRLATRLLSASGLCATIATLVGVVTKTAHTLYWGWAVPMAISYIFIRLYGVARNRMDFASRVAASVVLITFGGWLVYIFVIDIYPTIPASFGGGKPRTALLDLRSEFLSEETIHAVQRERQRRQSVIRTRELRVIASRDTIIVLSLRRAGSTTNQPLVVKREAVQNIIWTD